MKMTGKSKYLLLLILLFSMNIKSHAGFSLLGALGYEDHFHDSSMMSIKYNYYTGIINMNLVSGATCELFHVGFILDSSLPSFYSNPTFFLEPSGVYFPTPFGLGPVIVYSEPLFVSVAAGTFPPVSGPAMIVGGLLAYDNGWEEGDVWVSLVVVEDSLMNGQTVPVGTVLDRVYIRWADPVLVTP